MLKFKCYKSKIISNAMLSKFEMTLHTIQCQIQEINLFLRKNLPPN